MSLLPKVLLALLLILPIAVAVEIDPAEQPLVQLRFPLTDATGDGAHAEVVYVLLKSGIGYSILNQWHQGAGAKTGSKKNRKTFWLDQPLIDVAVAAARSFPKADATVSPSQQVIIEGTAVDGGQIVSSWRIPGTKTLLLLTIFGGVRDELQNHFQSKPAEAAY